MQFFGTSLKESNKDLQQIKAMISNTEYRFKKG